MLDKRCLALLNILNGECQKSGYKIFSITELVCSMPVHFNIDKDGVRECVHLLAEREYISVKYEDEEEICACPLPKGRLTFENRLDEEVEKVRLERKCFIFSFTGGVLGGLIATILAVTLLVILKGGI